MGATGRATDARRIMIPTSVVQLVPGVFRDGGSDDIHGPHEPRRRVGGETCGIACQWSTL